MKTDLLVLALVGLVTAPCQAQSFAPNHDRTPGAVNAAVTQENIQSTVCAEDWIKSVQPPAKYTEQLKVKQMKALHLKGKPQDYVEDHLIPLCLGGEPRDPRNLWPQRIAGDWNAKVKDQLETAVCSAVCNGDRTLREGQDIFLEPDWTKEFLKWYHAE